MADGVVLELMNDALVALPPGADRTVVPRVNKLTVQLASTKATVFPLMAMFSDLEDSRKNAKT